MDQPKRHVNSYIHTIIQYIKPLDRRVPFEEIQRMTFINLNDNKKVLEMLNGNTKVEVGTDWVEFKPAYQIRNVEDLEKILKDTNCRNGIEMDKLIDSPVDIRKYVKELEEKGKIFVLKDTDGAEIVFYNKIQVEKCNEKIKNLWEEIKVPSYQDICKELSSAGIKVEQKFYEEKKNIVKKKSKVKKYKRKIKITNTHVKGLNLNDLD